MKAEEIRSKDLLSGPSDMPGDNIRDCAFFLQEIAAQFADLNERLDGFMGSMLQLTKAINQLNAQITAPEPPEWWTGKPRS